MAEKIACDDSYNFLPASDVLVVTRNTYLSIVLMMYQDASSFLRSQIEKRTRKKV